jgi:hypothetical protein
MFSSPHEATTESATRLDCEGCSGTVGMAGDHDIAGPSLPVISGADCTILCTLDIVADLLLAPLPGTDVTAAEAGQVVGPVVVLGRTDRDWLTPDSRATGRVA